VHTARPNRPHLLKLLDDVLGEINRLEAASQDHESLCLVFEAASDAIVEDQLELAKAILTSRRPPTSAPARSGSLIPFRQAAGG
jgi:hypothetical protein